MEVIKVCRHCREEFTGRNKIFCSEYCRNNSDRPKKDPSALMRNECKTCGSYCKRSGNVYCSNACYAKSREGKPGNTKGYKQSKETIEKRIKNTNQEEKEERRKLTMLEKYGVDNPSQLEEVKKMLSAASKGKARPRVEGQQDSIISSKRRNGTLAHTKETKIKISESLNKLYSDPNFDRSIFIRSGSNGKNSKTGYCNGLYFRSSYEEKFIMFCERYEIKVVSAENKNHCVKYPAEDGKQRSYYPDFYLPDCKTTVEIKPISMYCVGNNPSKIHTACQQAENFVVLTEIDGFLYEDCWQEFYDNQVKYWFC